MTNEENIATLNEHLEHWKRLLSEKICDQSEGEKTIDALQNAIKALEQEPCDSDLCEALGIAVKNFNDDKTDVIFSGSRVHYELRNETHNYQMVTPFDNQHSQEGIRAWFKANHLSADFPEGRYAIVKVTETEKVEVVEELEG